jgi:hypothetical protein
MENVVKEQTYWQLCCSFQRAKGWREKEDPETALGTGLSKDKQHVGWCSQESKENERSK